MKETTKTMIILCVNEVYTSIPINPMVINQSRFYDTNKNKLSHQVTKKRELHYNTILSRDYPINFLAIVVSTLFSSTLITKSLLKPGFDSSMLLITGISM